MPVSSVLERSPGCGRAPGRSAGPSSVPAWSGRQAVHHVGHRHRVPADRARPELRRRAGLLVRPGPRLRLVPPVVVQAGLRVERVLVDQRDLLDRLVVVLRLAGLVWRTAPRRRPPCRSRRATSGSGRSSGASSRRRWCAAACRAASRRTAPPSCSARPSCGRRCQQRRPPAGCGRGCRVRTGTPWDRCAICRDEAIQVLPDVGVVVVAAGPRGDPAQRVGDHALGVVPVAEVLRRSGTARGRRWRCGSATRTRRRDRAVFAVVKRARFQPSPAVAVLGPRASSRWRRPPASRGRTRAARRATGKAAGWSRRSRRRSVPLRVATTARR